MGFKKLKYADRLKQLGIYSLERRMCGNLNEVYKIFTKKDRVDKDKFFKSALYDHGLWSHIRKFFKQRSTVKRTFFSNRVLNNWNNLLQYVIDATSVNTFKELTGQELERYGHLQGLQTIPTMHYLYHQWTFRSILCK